jgi:hypothetical protein
MARSIELQNFYKSREWIAFRLMLIALRGPVCQECGRVIARTIDIIGHHTTPLTIDNYKDRSISLNPDKVELVCFDCHNKVEQRFGYVPTKQVFIVYGAPMSGKTMLTKQLMQRNDIVVDINEIYQAITGLPSYDKPNALYSNAVAVQNLLIDQVRTRYGKWNNAYIVGGYPDPYKRSKLISDIGAELLLCEASQDECVSRLCADADRAMMADQYKQYIAKWFQEYRE